MEYDYIVVGGGIVGAATARHLLKARPDASLLLIEKESALATHQTGHNSGVVHSGIYYEPGSLKAELCRQGARETREFVDEHGIPVLPLGKLLVATTALEVARLADLVERARQNGITAEAIDAAELRRREPHVSGLGALAIPETAVTDYRAVTRALMGEVSKAGGEAWLGTRVQGVREGERSVLVTTTRGDAQAGTVVFCAGLQADRMAALCGLDIDFQILPFRGEYYDVAQSRAGLVSTLVYPVPDPGLPFLGVHLTPTLEGGLTVGPNAVLGFAREGYPKLSVRWEDVRDMATFPGLWTVARSNLRMGLREMRNSWWKRGYLRECRKYCPSLMAEDLTPREAGIRAQAVMRDGSFVDDFLLRRTKRTLHVINAPSPAATSALPIGDRLASMAVRIGDAV